MDDEKRVVDGHTLKGMDLESLVILLRNDLSKGATHFHITRAVPNSYRLVTYKFLTPQQRKAERIQFLRNELKQLENEN